MKIRAHRNRRRWRPPITTCTEALAWLARHGYQETTDDWGDWRSFTDDTDENLMGYYYCRTEADIIGLVAKLSAKK